MKAGPRRSLYKLKRLLKANKYRTDLTKVLSSLDNLILGSMGVKRHAGQWGSTAYAVPTFLSPFQKHFLITQSTLLFHLSNGAKWNVKHF
jgi:hypothetical protein